MKKLIISTLAFLFLTCSMSAQNSSFLIGVHAGTNMNKVKPTGDFTSTGLKQKRQIGFAGGLDLGVKFNSFSILTGVQYVQHGGKSLLERNDPNNPFIFSDGTADVGKLNATTGYNTLSIPLLLRYETKGDLAFSVSLGPVMNSILGKGTYEETYVITSGTKGPFNSELSVGSLGTDFYKKSSVGFMFSPGVLYQIGDSGKLRVNINIYSGGNAINPNYLVNTSSGIRLVNAKETTSSFGLEIGYEHRMDFNIGSKY